jgi:UTP--glucose-1-phosphate uridylyltransferase
VNRNSLTPFIRKMRFERLPEAAIELFAPFYEQMAAGSGSIIPESVLKPVEPDQVESLASLQPYRTQGEEALEKTVVAKLNGGLGTTMGVDGPKSLFEAKEGLSFLDIITEEVRHMNRKRGLDMPLLLMNSFFTDPATTGALRSHQNHAPVFSFVQHKFPKVLAATLEPSLAPGNRLLEWNPAGHGDFLLSIETSGMFERLVNAGCRYLFVSNTDNLSAQLDSAILGYLHSERLDFVMEVTKRTPMDRKGGHLARFRDGRLMLREASQCGDGREITRALVFN